MTDKKKNLNVGLVMPIAPIDGCSAEHWIDVKRIIKESLFNLSGYISDPKIVSEGNSVGLIHKRIVEGLYTSDIIVCDVSCKNPNVMFELGMRLAFDRPTVIIKDDQTDYSFDTGVIEHLQYPRDLRYKEIVDFKDRLAEKVKATYENSLEDPDHSPFLKSFGTFKVASLKESEVSADQFIINALKELQADVAAIKAFNRSDKKASKATFDISLEKETAASLQNALIKSILENYLANRAIDEALSISEIVKHLDEQLRTIGYPISPINLEAIVMKYLNKRN